MFFGCVAKLVEIRRRRSPSIRLSAVSGREVKRDGLDWQWQSLPSIDLAHLDLPGGRCQTNSNPRAVDKDKRVSSRKLTPFSQCRRAVSFENTASVEVALMIEMVVDRGVDRGEFP